MFSISIRDEGCDVKIIVVEIIGDSESEYRGNTLGHLSGCRWGEEKRKRVTQIRRWEYMLTRGGDIFSQETTCTSRKIFIYCKNIYSRVQSALL